MTLLEHHTFHHLVVTYLNMLIYTLSHFQLVAFRASDLDEVAVFDMVFYFGFGGFEPTHYICRTLTQFELTVLFMVLYVIMIQQLFTTKLLI